MPTSEEVKLIIKAVTEEAVQKLDKYNQKMNEVDQGSSKMKKGFESLKTSWIAVSAAAVSVGLAISKALDLAQTAAKFNQSVEAMEMQFGVSSDVILNKLREVSDGTISNTELVTAANRAMALNVTRDVDTMAQLLEYARLRARAMGIDTTQAFNDIVTGIGRGSPLILDNLGIITKGWAEEARAAGIAYDAQYILNKVLEQSAEELERVGELALTDAEKFQKLNAEWENIKLTLGVGVLQSITILWEGIKKIHKAYEDWMFISGKLGYEVDIVFLNIAKVATDVAVKIAEPFIWAINKMIEGLNKLPGVHIEKMNNIIEQGAEFLERLIEQKELELQIYEEARQQDIENIQAANDKKVDLEKKYLLNINKALSKSKDKEKKIKQKSLMDIALEEDRAIKNQLKKEIEYKKLSYQIDTELLNLKIQNRGIDTQSLTSFWNFALSSLDQSSRSQFKIWKAMSIANAVIATAQAAINAYNALAGIPIVGPGLGAAAAAVAVAFGTLKVNKIKNTQFQGAEEGALIRGTPMGTLINVGERNKEEAIVPLEDADVMERMGGTTVNIYNDTAIMDEEYPQELAIKIDNALYKLGQEGLRKS